MKNQILETTKHGTLKVLAQLAEFERGLELGDSESHEPPGQVGLTPAIYCNAKILLGGDLLALLLELHERFADGPNMAPVRFNFFGMPAVLVTKPAHVETVFKDTEHFSSGSEPRTLDRFRALLGFNLISADHETWQQVRPRTAAAFAGASMAEYGEVMRAVMVEDVLPTLRRESSQGRSIEVFETMLEFSSKAVFRSFMRLPGHAVSDDVHPALNRLFCHVRSQVIEPGLPLWVPTPANRAFKRDREAVRSFVRPFIDAHATLDTLFGTTVRGHTTRVRGRTREDIEQVCATIRETYNTADANDESEAGDGLREVVRPLLAQQDDTPVFDIAKRVVRATRSWARERGLEPRVVEHDLHTKIESVLCRDGLLDRERVLEEMVSNLIGGSETTILMMTWGLYYLSTNPAAQDRIRDECLANDDAEVPLIDPSALKTRWPYLFNVLREILRLASPAAAFNRPVIADTELDGFSLPAGTLVWGSQYITHRSPHVWDTPEAFRPERFEQAIEPGSFFPFTLGPRMCVGMTYAYIEAGYALVTICRHFRVECLTKSVGYDMGLTFRPDRPVHVRLHPRADEASGSSGSSGSGGS